MPPSPPRSRRTAGATSKRAAGPPHQPLIRDLLAVGESRRNMKLAAADHAALTVVVEAMMNLDDCVRGQGTAMEQWVSLWEPTTVSDDGRTIGVPHETLGEMVVLSALT